MSAEPSLSALLLTIALLSPSPKAARPAPAVSPSPSAAADAGLPVILFLIDNSASLPPLDPNETRVAALDKMFRFVSKNPYRLVLFGGKHEVFVDELGKYRSTGQWTDYYHAFLKARDIMAEYPKGTDFRMLLFTDAILDPSPADWDGMSIPPGDDLKAHVAQRTVALVREMGVPLYVILVGDAPSGPASHPERAPGLILDMTRAANGARATAFAQTVADFFEDDGLLLKKFVFRVDSAEGLKAIEPVVTRIAAPSSPTVETGIFAALVLPLALFLFLLVGILVRSFPGRGDVEVLELPVGQPVHVAADRLHRLESGGWGGTGLALVGDPRDATATFTLRPPEIDLTGAGTDVSEADEMTRALLPLPLEELRRALEDKADEGTKEEKIFALNLDYMARNLSASEVERALTMPAAQRSGIPALGFLRAKAHLLSNDALRGKLLEPRVHVVTYGRQADRKEVLPGTQLRIGPYAFRVASVVKGGRKDVRVFLEYERIPSLAGLKNWVPGRLQRAARFRSDSQRVVS